MSSLIRLSIDKIQEKTGDRYHFTSSAIASFIIKLQIDRWEFKVKFKFGDRYVFLGF
ncbi:hypothetical protein [Limnoraphis robusta]|uniref:Uncharacterized protein n=1 Tax=Limnoraphis robusta CCNP1315 TaxID=3110306 RepID=A0ABU5U5Z9_9CYAN|nr:hypothetical protein [Limnoraphis robusta]MEA5522584.1 hypothetical protein [Limnoraphis robusta CCNP1315]MEA5548577.1 hypothetical protein [Limnoraphis robusta CCNP1324]